MTMHKIVYWTVGSACIGVVTIALCKYYYHYCNTVKSRIVVIDSTQQWEEIALTLYTEVNEKKVVGFDCEWVSRKEYNGRVALLQLATTSGLCVLVRLCRIQNVPTLLHLKDLLADKIVAQPFLVAWKAQFNGTQVEINMLAEVVKKILKVGVGCHQDATKLLQDHGLVVLGYLDLGWLGNVVYGDRLQRYGLSAIAKQVLGVEMDKSWTVRCSDWEAPTLNERQVQYAASDALVAIRAFERLVYLQLRVVDRIFKSSYRWNKTVPHIKSWLDRPFKPKNSQKNKSVKSCSPSKPVKDNRYKCAHNIRKRPLYHNCFLLAPDGQPLCTCDVKKVQWYLDKDLAERVSTDPIVICLKFEPSRRPFPDEAFYLQDKNNCCVVCGKTDSYICKNVVPHEYRRHFPKIMKDHRSHDVILLCMDCHRVSNLSDVTFRRKLAEKYDAPLGSANVRTIENSQLKKIKSAAKALITSGSSIPPKRICELQKILCNHFGTPEITTDILNDALHLDTKMENDRYLSHGLEVVRRMSTSEGLLVLERQWRQHFLDTMQPSFLPYLWSVDHGHESLRRRVHKHTADDAILFGTQEIGN